MVGEKQSVKPIMNFISKPRKNKILIMGDSRARRCAANLSPSLNETFEVMGTVMPGFRLEHITSLALREMTHLDRNDHVVISGSMNDISRNESHVGLRHMRKFALQNNHTNIMAVTPPHRHDLPDFSCVNKETQVLSRRLHKLLKDMHHTSVVDINLTRDKFTWHRLHMSPSCRERIAKIIGQTITTPLTSGIPPISLKWKSPWLLPLLKQRWYLQARMKMVYTKS